ncbi:MAG: NYN domain-containing protein [Chloroflexota bacterium]
MPYLIDGHNLIAKVPGIHLHGIEDEQQLIERLQSYCRMRRRQVDVYFDNAPPGQPAVRKYGAVTAYFVRQGKTADQAIQDRLLRLGRGARNWVVVTSDRAVQAAARASQATVMSSEAFADDMALASEQVDAGLDQQDVPTLTQDELDDWLAMFGAKGH